MKPACRSCDTASASSATWILLLLLSSAAQLGLCLGHGTGGASGSHTGVPASNNLRRLQQAPAPPPSASPKASAPPSARSATGNATTAPQQPGLCKFDDAQERCTPTHDAWKSAGPGMPSSHYRRAVLMASERERHCSQHTTPQACAADWKMRCFRQGAANATNARCASSDMEEMLVFSAKGFMADLAVIPHGMTCPDTPARAFFDCYAFAGRLDACRARPQCTVLDGFGTMRNVCVPKSWLGKKMGELRKVFKGLEGLSTDAFGSCGAACWLQEARACSNLTTQAACAAVPYCTYDQDAAAKAQGSILLPPLSDAEEAIEEDDGGVRASIYGSRPDAAKALTPGGCRHKSQEFSSSNAMDQAAQKVYKQCQSATTKAACLAVKRSAPASSTSSRRVAMVDWKRYEPNKAAVNCSSSSGGGGSGGGGSSTEEGDDGG